MLGAMRDLAGLALGEGALRSFLLDILTFAAAAFMLCGFAAGASGSGVGRWYMAGAMGVGALSWKWTASGVLHRTLHCILSLLCLPLRWLEHHIRQPILRRIGSLRKNNSRKKSKKEKNVLQKEQKILYN